MNHTVGYFFTVYAIAGLTLLGVFVAVQADSSNTDTLKHCEFTVKDSVGNTHTFKGELR